jgi:hypothetical protein
MRKAIEYFQATAGTFVLVLFAMTAEAQTPNIENGVGVVCDSPRQVEQVIILRSDFKTAVAEINAQNNSRVCEILNVAFLVGGIVAEAQRSERGADRPIRRSLKQGKNGGGEPEGQVT